MHESARQQKRQASSLLLLAAASGPAGRSSSMMKYILMHALNLSFSLFGLVSFLLRLATPDPVSTKSQGNICCASSLTSGANLHQWPVAMD